MQAEVLVSAPRPSTHIDDDMALVLPQSWYVWNSRGGVTCNCVLSHDALVRAAHARTRPVVVRARAPTWGPSLVALYKLDAELYRNMSARLRHAHASTCYYPRPRHNRSDPRIVALQRLRARLKSSGPFR